MFIQAEAASPGSNPFLVNIDVKNSTFIPAGIILALGYYSSASVLREDGIQPRARVQSKYIKICALAGGQRNVTVVPVK